MPESAVATPRHDHDYPLVGETIGMWRLLRGLGRGGMGEVYEAEYDYLHLLTLRYGEDQRHAIRTELESLSRPEQARLAGQLLGALLPADMRFAIKICNARSGTPGYRRFLQEAEVAQRLGDHPYIVTVHQINGEFDGDSEIARKLMVGQGRHRDLAYMVMDLATCTFNHAHLTIGEAVHIVRCIADALDHAHGKGVVHRDLKPENILGTIEQPLLTDFGIAKEIDQTEGLTRTGQIIGTLDYMSPEQATDAKRVDHRSDIYSLGVVLYEFATQGHLPYAHKLDRDSCLAAIRNDKADMRWPREHKAGFPVRLERIILRCMAHRPEDRYQGMSEFIADLDRFVRGERIGWWGRVPAKQMGRFQVRRHPKLIYGTLTAAILTVMVAGLYWGTRLLDPDRRMYGRELGQIEAEADIIADPHATPAGRTPLCQLSADNAAHLEQLHLSLTDGKYPEFEARLATVDDMLLRSRRLDLYFAGSAPPPTAYSALLRFSDAMDALKLAAGVQSADWTLTSAHGLKMNLSQVINLRHYGKGVVYWNLRIDLPTAEGFQLRTQESDDNGSRHTVRWVIADGCLDCLLREDEKPEARLRREGPLQSHVINVALEMTADHIRTWVDNRVARTSVRGLRKDSPADISLSLPQDTYIERLQVMPLGPSE
jgi:hypothetical protein